jgi:hypothetical protein
MKMKNPLAVVTLIYAIAATAAAQTPAPAANEIRGETEIRMPGGGVVVVFPGQSGGTGTAYASTTLVCENKHQKIRLSTGNDSGHCESSGNGVSASCTDSINSADGDCYNGCTKKTGTGSCNVEKW